MSVTFLPQRAGAAEKLRRRIVEDFEKGAGRHDDPAVYGGPPGDPGLLGPDSISWEINADLASVSQAGLPAIVLEILHPSVVAGVQDLSNYREDPFQRARATLGYVLTTTFGNTEAANRVIEHVKHVHSFVNGTCPDGTPYQALDPELIGWVHTCIPWMILRTYEQTKRPLSREEQDRYLAEQAVIGRMGGADWVPTTAAELDDYVEAMRPKLSVNAQTREFIDFLMTSPFFPDLPAPVDRRLHRFAIYAGMSRAPLWARELIGYDRPSALTRRLMGPALQFDARQTRWAFGTPRYVQLARERAAGALLPQAAAQ
ncbi:oxygenase MpaB family protein [Mycobacterium sp. 2YAF39]|uniref:oxygenase MpaB family protein n=1 Tax=Mycobacterium sp. 2YAF39 TaxID=3233033 RepID=UPI003F9DDC48